MKSKVSLHSRIKLERENMASTSNASKPKRSLFDVKKELEDERVAAAIADLTGGTRSGGESEWTDNSDIESDVEEVRATPPKKKVKGTKGVTKAVTPIKEKPRRSPRKVPATKKAGSPQKQRYVENINTCRNGLLIGPLYTNFSKEL